MCNNKKNVIIYSILSVVLLIGIIFTYNDFYLYDSTIAKVVSVESTYDHETEGLNGEIEKYYVQTITAVIKNGEYKGQTVTLENDYTYSGVASDEYRVGNYLFITVKGESDSGLTGAITGMKRDVYVAIMAAILFLGIIITAGRKGILVTISVFVNIAIYTYAFHLYIDKGENIVTLTNVMIVAFTIFTLIIVSGINKQSLTAIISTLLSIAILIFIYNIVIKYGEEPEYMMMEYITNPDDIESIFMAGVLIGGLGAIMDVAISIAVAVNEIILNNPKITIKNLIKSIKEIGYDIMGTMINVLFFSYMAGTIPMIILKIKNDYNLTTLVKFQIPFEIIRFLVGSIGIIITIPVAGFVAVLIMKKRGTIND